MSSATNFTWCFKSYKLSLPDQGLHFFMREQEMA